VRRFGEKGEGERAREREAAGSAPPEGGGGGRRLPPNETAPPFLRKSGEGYRFCRPEVERREAEATGRVR